MSKWFYSRNLVPSGVLLLWPLYFFFFFFTNVWFVWFPLRYFGFITKHPADQRFACHVFVSEDSTKPLAESVGWGLRTLFVSVLKNIYISCHSFALCPSLLYCQRIQEVLSHSGPITTNIEHCLNARWSLVKPPICAKFTRTADLICNHNWPLYYRSLKLMSVYKGR